MFKILEGATNSIVEEFIAIVGSWITGAIGWLGDAFTGITALFYVSGSGFTFLGVLMLFGLAIGLVKFGIAFVRGLIQK